jgi:hypothetical protein
MLAVPAILVAGLREERVVARLLDRFSVIRVLLLS